MTQTITIEELQKHAGELLAHLGAADEIVVATPGGNPLARIRAAGQVAVGSTAREMGFWKDQIRTASDFDQPLPDNFWLGEEI